MTTPPLTFKGLLSKTTVSDQTFKRFMSKIEDLRKVSSYMVEYLLLVHKGMQFFNSYLIKQSQSLQSQLTTDPLDDKRYYSQFSFIFGATAANFEHFDCTFQTNLKEFHVNTSMEIDELTTVHMDDLMGSYKKYRTLEDSMHDSGKKWLKAEKQLAESIKSYNESFVDPKLIYNKEETNKRYSHCEATYHNAVKEEVNIIDKADKIYEVKKYYIELQSRFLDQYAASCEFVNEKIIMEMKKVMELFCDIHKNIVSDIATKRKPFEDVRIKCFLYSVPDMSQERQCFNVSSTFISQGKFPMFLQNPECIKDVHLKLFSRWMSEYGQFLKDCADSSKKMSKRLHSFIYELMRTIEKMATYILKQIPACFEKIKKKMTEMFGVKTVEFIKCINKTLEHSMKIYQKLAKFSWQKLDVIAALLTQDNKMAEMFFKEYYKQLQLFNHQTKLMDTLQHKKQIRSCISQKSEIIKYCLNSFGQKLTKNSEIVRMEINSIMNELFAALNEIFICSSEYQRGCFDEDFVENLGRIKEEGRGWGYGVGEKMGMGVMEEKVGVVETERFKYVEFNKIKKAEVKVRESGVEGKEEAMVRAQSANIEQPKRTSSSESIVNKNSLIIDPKQKKNFQFIRSKINFEEGQRFIRTFSCALNDKILLQGKLYLTSQRLCFHSYFNIATLFFGGTFLQIPKKDIIKAEKRLNAKIFDNSIAIKTVNGEVFFTSFIVRDEAYKDILSAFGLKPDDEQKQQGLENEDVEVEKQQIQNPQNKQPKHEEQQLLFLSQPDDISPQQLQQRTHKLQQLATPKNLQKLSTHLIKNTTCLYFLTRFFSNLGYTTHDGHKHPSFYHYLKQQFGQKQIYVSDWQPSVEIYLNKNNIKKDTPLQFTRKVRFNHTLPKSGIPFMPKFCKTEETDTLVVVSAERFFIDFRVTSSGAPYTDTFICHTREDYANTTKGMEITSYLYLEFVKKTMMQGIIQKQAQKDMRESAENYAKLLARIVGKDQKLRKVVKKIVGPVEKDTANLSSPNQVETADNQKLEQQQEQQLQQPNFKNKYSQLLDEHQSLQKKYLLFRNIIIALVLLNILQLVF